MSEHFMEMSAAQHAHKEWQRHCANTLLPYYDNLIKACTDIKMVKDMDPRYSVARTWIKCDTQNMLPGPVVDKEDPEAVLRHTEGSERDLEQLRNVWSQMMREELQKVSKASAEHANVLDAKNALPPPPVAHASQEVEEEVDMDISYLLPTPTSAKRNCTAMVHVPKKRPRITPTPFPSPSTGPLTLSDLLTEGRMVLAEKKEPVYLPSMKGEKPTDEPLAEEDVMCELRDAKEERFVDAHILLTHLKERHLLEFLKKTDFRKRARHLGMGHVIEQATGREWVLGPCTLTIVQTADVLFEEEELTAEELAACSDAIAECITSAEG